jgi:hypothetical protein
LALAWRLAATAFFLWLLAGCFQARIGTSFEGLRLLIDIPQWHPQWPWGPWLLGVGGLALAWALRWRGKLTLQQQERLAFQLRQLSLLTGALLLLRLASLLPPCSALFPFLVLLWSPHLTWALSAAYLLYPLAPLLPALSTRSLALALLLVSGAALSLWSLYFCQMTMLHGDEAHYLRVTQSLLRDGDMDLSNNLGDGPASEYHVIDFPPHQAPGSPPGEIHSVHPIGLSALLLPSYWAGLVLWANPRLACSLLIALLSAGAATLVFLWLARLGFDRWQALACALIGATTTPFFLYTTQLYPEIPALSITLLSMLLLAHWQRPGFQYEPLGRREPLLLAGLAALLLCLLFLHPRYLPLALFLGAGLALQVRHSPQRRQSMRLLLPLGGVGALALVAYNYAYSGDPFGPFLPGNAWEENALQGSTWLLSLPGHWLHVTTGLLNSSPFFLASALGLVGLARRRDPRIWGALAFYLVTAGVNGLHPDWTFGFCPPARFLLTAFPLLLWGLALFLREYEGRMLPLFALLFALVLAWDGVLTTLALPEQAFGGDHLLVRALDEFYPLDIHFFSQHAGDLPWADISFWTLLSAGLAAGLWPSLDRRWRLAALLGAGLLPCVWGQSSAIAGRLNNKTSPYFFQLDPAGQFAAGVRYYNRSVDSEYQMTTGHAIKSGGYQAMAPKDQAGILRSYYAPLIQPGIVTYTLSGVYAQHAPGQVADHFSIAQRQILPAIADWGIFRAQPLRRRYPTLRGQTLLLHRPGWHGIRLGRVCRGWGPGHLSSAEPLSPHPPGHPPHRVAPIPSRRGQPHLAGPALRGSGARVLPGPLPPERVGL